MDESSATPLPNLIHEPPSLPSSPHRKRTKVIDSFPEIIPESGNATPTPPTMTLPTNHPTRISVKEDLVPSLQIQILSTLGRAPTRGSAFAAGYDLYSAENATVPARGKGMISTGIAIAVPAGTYGRVAPRSGLAVKHSIHTGAGVIDADYRGEVKVVLFNFSDIDFEIKEGDRIAQLILERIYTPEVEVVSVLEATVRGDGGFGSTGGFGASASMTGTTTIVAENGA